MQLLKDGIGKYVIQDELLSKITEVNLYGSLLYPSYIGINSRHSRWYINRYTKILSDAEIIERILIELGSYDICDFYKEALLYALRGS